MQNSAIISTFIKLPFVVMTFVLSIFESPFDTGFTAFVSLQPYAAMSKFCVSSSLCLGLVCGL